MRRCQTTTVRVTSAGIPPPFPFRRRLTYIVPCTIIWPMRLTLAQTREFASQWRRLGLTDDDLRKLENLLLADPNVGKPMAGTGGLRKMRFSPPSWHTGKSGATRVGYSYFPVFETIYLIALYAKQEKDNLTASERNQVRKVLATLAASLEQSLPKG
jgi:hypothetical protein